MPQKCSICIHPCREDIDTCIVSGEPLRRIAEQFSVSSTALHRHKKHLSLDAVKSHEVRELLHANNILNAICDLHSRATSILNTAEEKGDLKTACSAIREIKGIIELVVKLNAVLEESLEKRIDDNQEWIELRGIIFDALLPFPEARERLIEVLEAS